MTDNIFIVGMLVFFATILYVVIKERIYQRKRKKVVAGAKFNNKDEMSTGESHWVEVVEQDYYHFLVMYRIVGEEMVCVMDIREFVKRYVP